ncbi:MAG: cell division protein SepF [Fimbriimonadaceae bacterium]|jgi:cell division inhibitor SepF|nr:cell division protein SepF [Fimbriimonadaceae bacterium]
MEEAVERPGLFTRLAIKFGRYRDQEEDYDDEVSAVEPTTEKVRPGLKVHTLHRYHVTVRRQIVAFEDAVAAANGLKRGEQQILNLSMAPAELREKIKDFMCGVNYCAEGTWEELGEGVYLLAPASAFVEVAPSSPRTQAARN